jgi:glycine/D-amino acid oxidase-like deaminating enzyme
MTSTSNHTLVLGAGIAGVAVAWQLAMAGQGAGVLLLDRQQPLSLTTSKSGENFRVYWPHACMAALAERSIELMHDLDKRAEVDIGLKFSGYDFVSENNHRELFPAPAEIAANWTRETDSARLRQRHAYLSRDIAQVLTITQAGAVDVQALGMAMLGQARAGGVRLERGEVTALAQTDSGFRLMVTGQNEPTVGFA